MPEPAKLDRDILRTLLSLAGKSAVDHLLYVSDHPLPAEEVKGKPWRKKRVYAVTQESLARSLEEEGFRAVTLPAYDYGRMERIKVALVLTSKLFRNGETVLCLTGQGKTIDTMIKIRVGEEDEDVITLESLGLPPEIELAVAEQVLLLAQAVGQEGFEGHPVGTILVLGDSTAVMEKSRQLTLNPFQGLSEAERNILDPKIREAVKNFSVLDGAFVIREDGVVLAAGRYLQSGGQNVKIPLGLGARHAAAAYISATTRAIAVVVSQTSGSVRIFRNGEIIYEMHPTHRRI
ncbi:MAG TPA: diadenylate cyclase [Fredinandcohnia sp.]|nr:diadenylate cyclase [Fredinandcohnia sp.]